MVSNLVDHIMINVHEGSGHYVLSAFVRDKVEDLIWLESMSYYLYDMEDLDKMKELFVVHVLSHNWEFVGDDYWD